MDTKKIKYRCSECGNVELCDKAVDAKVCNKCWYEGHSLKYMHMDTEEWIKSMKQKSWYKCTSCGRESYLDGFDTKTCQFCMFNRHVIESMIKIKTNQIVDNEITLLFNERKGLDDFNPKHKCDFCENDEFHECIVRLNQNGIQICKTHLAKFIKTIDDGIMKKCLEFSPKENDGLDSKDL